MNDKDDNCKCIKIIGELEYVKWMSDRLIYRPSPGNLALGDWVQNPFIWMHYTESTDGRLAKDDVLMSTDTRYWDIHDVQRYFLAEEHCEQVLFVYQYPNMRLPTRLGDYLWRANVAMKKPTNLYMKTLNRDLEITLKKIKAHESQMDRLIISDQLVKLDRLDCFRRKSFMELLLNTISFQNHLQLVSFENMCCKRLEGVRLIQQLACFNAHTLKYLFLWDFVLPNENPILINYSYITGSGQYLPRPDTRQCFLRSLGELTNLRVLALEYSHIADGSGLALMSLLPVLKRPHFRLQLMCRETYIPGKTNAALGTGGHLIPDQAWRKVIIACPDLYLLMAFFRIRDYDNIRRFLTPSMALREVHLQFGIDLKMRQRQDSDISCFVRHMAFHYADTLVTLSIHQWRFAVFPLRRILELMPHLVRLFYVGQVEDEVDLRRFLDIIASGVCDRLKQVKIQIQDNKSTRAYWQSIIDVMTEEYLDIMKLYEINLCLTIYKH
ncbi:uncharacterized protein LOC142986280 [Anticarsia gemmatalis]|uniref:uncharacterized protein LOC142986280 n=1 Tax=Anticarsia gemmatalis TaxID=129554 RepID=UPI003F75AA85